MVDELLSSRYATAVLAAAVLVLLVVGLLAAGLRRVAPDQALIVPRRRGEDRVVIGGWVLLWPFARRYRMPLSQQRFELTVDGVDEQMVAVRAEVTVGFAVQGDPEGVRRAVRRFFSRPEAMASVVEESLESALRAEVGRRPVRKTLADRSGIVAGARSAIQTEMADQGLVVDLLAIGEISTPGSDYLADLGRVEVARARSQAEVAEAEADRAARIAVIEAQREVAESEHALELRRAELTADAARARATGEGAARIAQAEQERLVAVGERAALAERALATDERLMIEVRKPAEAERDRLLILAEGLRAEAEARSESTARDDAAARPAA